MQQRMRLLALASAVIASTSIANVHAAPIVTRMSDAGGPTAGDLVNSMLAGSSGISIVPGSINYTGSLTASGTFSNGGNNPSNSIGIDKGILLTSGDAKFVSNVPNTNGGASNDNGASGSSLLGGIIGATT